MSETDSNRDIRTMNPQQTMQFQQQMNEQMMLNQTQQAPPPVQNMGDVINSAEGQKRFLRLWFYQFFDVSLD